MTEFTDKMFSDELATSGYDADPGVFDKLRDLCKAHQLDVDGIINHWLSYSKSKNLSLSTENLEHFEREKLNKCVSKISVKTVDSSPYHYTRNPIDEVRACDEYEDDIVNQYCTPDNSCKKRLQTGESVRGKCFSRLNRSPGLPFSPRSLASPATASSEKYKNRTNSGETLVSFGVSGDTVWSRQGKREVKVSNYCSKGNFKDIRFMFQKLGEKACILSNQIDDIGNQIKDFYKIEEFCHAGLHHQNTVTLMGSIGCDENGRLNSSSAVLQGSLEVSFGRSVALDLSFVPQYSLFPGQRVAVDGTNPTRSKFIVSKVHDGIMLPSSTKPVLIQGTLTMVVACGPFTISDNDLYEPLDDLLKYLDTNPPDVCILMGPFVDSKAVDSEKLETLEVSFDEIFKRKMADIIFIAQSLGIRLVVLPSQRDVHHEWVYPQPPFVFDKSHELRNVHFMPDPCTLDVDGVIVGATSTDILFHLGAEEISQAQTMDRFSRLAHHLLTQHCYYPLHPPGPDVNLDTELQDRYGQMMVTPHIFLLPSDLRYFVKFAGSVVCINPGRLAKGLIGGSFARISINQPKDNELLSSCVAVEIMRI